MKNVKYDVSELQYDGNLSLVYLSTTYLAASDWVLRDEICRFYNFEIKEYI